MKKKLIVLASTALFAVGLAFYANYSNTMNVIIDSDIEALSDGNDPSAADYQETEDFIIFTSLNKLFVKHGVNKTRWGSPINTCKDGGAGCLIDLANQTSGEQSENASWAEKITDWVLDTAKSVVLALIKK